MTSCIFVSDLHGRSSHYAELFEIIEEEAPAGVFLGGDLLPGGLGLARGPQIEGDFVSEFLAENLSKIRKVLKDRCPRFFAILGNDDPRVEERSFLELADRGLLDYVHNRRVLWGGHVVYGYSFVPPSPFMLKDWERYDISRYVDPGCVSPEDGYRSVSVPEHTARFATIRQDLNELVGDEDLENAVMLFHAPPYKSLLDRAALDGKMIDHVPLDVHVGSEAIRRLIAARRPLVTLHGHVHESSRLTGHWRDRIGRTVCLSAAHETKLAVIRFDLENPGGAIRELL